MKNLYDETVDILREYGLKLSDVEVIFRGKILNNDLEIKKELDRDYNSSWGGLHFQNIQLIIDDYMWFERTSYDGCEKYILRAHPLSREYEHRESHQGFESV